MSYVREIVTQSDWNDPSCTEMKAQAQIDNGSFNSIVTLKLVSVLATTLPKKEIQEPKLFVFCFSLHCVPALGGRALSLLIPPGHSLCGPSSSRRLAEALLLSTWDKLLPMGRRQFLGCLSAQGAAGVRNRQKKMLCMSDLPYRKSLGRHGSSAPDPANVQGVMPSN